MPTEIVWQISEGQLVSPQDASLKASRDESDLESWIARDPEILADDLLVIDRQRPIAGVGRLDLLCIDRPARLAGATRSALQSSRSRIGDIAEWQEHTQILVFETSVR